MVDEENGHLVMEKIEGRTVKQFLFDAHAAGTFTQALARLCDAVAFVPGKYDTDGKTVASKIGIAIARLHDAKVVHGDLTTSNMMIENGTDRLVGTHAQTCIFVK